MTTTPEALPGHRTLNAVAGFLLTRTVEDRLLHLVGRDDAGGRQVFASATVSPCGIMALACAASQLREKPLTAREVERLHRIAAYLDPEESLELAPH
ncbi:hypothetical protein NHF40_12515 [Maricaulaceae bacterium EIL42A08]|nr:hypothetical protein [Maricaulaceae bacterium EIL42A08]